MQNSQTGFDFGLVLTPKDEKERRQLISDLPKFRPLPAPDHWTLVIRPSIPSEINE